MILSKSKFCNSLAVCENASVKRMSFKDSVCCLVLLFLSKSENHNNALDLTPLEHDKISNAMSLQDIKRKLSWEFKETGGAPKKEGFLLW